jgi:nucleotide-binding universal stress UspA family protein
VAPLGKAGHSALPIDILGDLTPSASRSGLGHPLRTGRKEVSMFKHILVATDGSPLSELAIGGGVNLAKALDARVTGLHVIEPFHFFGGAEMASETREQYEKASLIRAQTYLDRIAAAAKQAGVSCDCVTEMSGNPFEAIMAAAETRGCDLIVMASHGRRGIRGLLLGSETVKVLTHSKIPVLVFR